MPVPVHDESRAGSPPGDEMDFDEPQWDMIDDLQSHGINAQDITKLKKEGICTVSAVRMTSRRNLLKIKVRRPSSGAYIR
ncbi:unnamed protein product, partial [Rhizoctonia solani]